MSSLSPAQVAVTALSGSPTISIAATSNTSTNDVAGVTPEISYTSSDGASQSFTSSQSSSTSSDLTDIYTVHGRDLPRLRPSAFALVKAALLGPTGAWAVGLGPLEKNGITAGPDKGFYITITNPYHVAWRFRALVEREAGLDTSCISILTAKAAIAGESKPERLDFSRL